MSAEVERAPERQVEPQPAAASGSPVATAIPTTANLRGKLTILSGTQQGAVGWLVQGRPLALGSSLDNDIVLRSHSVEQLHASLLLTHETLTIRCIAGTVVANGGVLGAGESQPLMGTVTVQLGDISMTVECVGDSSSSMAPGEADRAAASNMPLGFDSAANAGLQEGSAEQAGSQAAFFMPSLDDLPATTTAQNSRAAAELTVQSAPRNFLTQKTTLLTMGTLLVGALVVWQSGLFRPAIPAPFELQPALAGSSFSGLQVSQFGSVATVSGFLETVQESRQLEQWLDQTGLNINNEVVVGETLGEKVLDMFRVHGIAAEVEVKEGGHVMVATSQPDTNILDGVDESIQTDMPGVASLTIKNTPPPISEPVAVASLDPGKRVAMVVSDEPAYIVTEDQSRYFVGSILPTGHRIASIENGKVNLEKNGVSSALEF